jgi:hypothetical protein
MPCEIRADGRQQRAIVLDFSRSGLFVQTSARLAPGTTVELEIQLDSTSPAVRVRARVARQKAVPSNLTSVAQGGVGLRILEAPPAYYAALDQHASDEDDAAATPPPREAPAPPPRRAAPRFKVRVKQTDGPRSRILDIEADDADGARARALAEVGKGWEIVEATAR